MRPTLLIRADASPLIGHGHIIRCLALAQMLKHEFTIKFICKEIPNELISDIKDSGFLLLRICAEEDFFSQVSDIVVLDGYQFDLNYQKTIKSYGATLVCIDDLCDREFVADLIINHSIGISFENYKTLPHTQFALGLKFALLRPPFLEQARKGRVIKEIKTVFVCFGGADINNHTYSTLGVLRSFSTIDKINVVTGASFSRMDLLEKSLDIDERISHFHDVKSADMLSLMFQSDLAIVPASSVLYEAMTAGCIIISGFIADNQRLIYEHAVKQGIAVDGKNFQDHEVETALITLLTHGFPEDRIPLRHLGNSKIEILKLFKQLLRFEQFQLREITAEDENITFQWASNPEIRKFSFSKNAINALEHQQWLREKIDNSDCIYLIGEVSGKVAGSIRFDIADDIATVSYLIDPLFHGEGFGTAILSKGIAFLEMRNDIRAIQGAVFKENIASIKAFQRLGFSINLEGSNFILFNKEVINEPPIIV